MGFASDILKEQIKEIQQKQRSVLNQNGSCGNCACRVRFVCNTKNKLLRTFNQYCHLWRPKNVT